MLSISSERQGDYLVIALTGRIDAASAKNLEQYCQEQIDNGEIRMVLDFSGVNYISSAALRVFLMVAKRLGALKGSVKLCALSPTLMDVFEISGFSKLFVIAATVQDALK